jgi:hypothetical protein
MSQLTLTAIPGFSDLPDSAIAAGQALTDTSMLALSHNAKFATVRGKVIFMGFYAHGNTVPTPIDPDDGYAYARAECQFVFMPYTNRAPASGFVPGQATPPAQSSSQPGPLYNWPGGWDINNQTGLVTLWTSYYWNGRETVNNDGIIKVYAICLRESSAAAPAPGEPTAPVAPTPVEATPVTYTPTPLGFSPPAGAEFFLPDTYLDSGSRPTQNPTFAGDPYLVNPSPWWGIVIGENIPGIPSPELLTGDCTWYGFVNPPGSISGVSLTVASRESTTTFSPGLGSIRYSLDGGRTWTTLRSGLSWDAMATPDVAALPDSQDLSLVRVEAIQQPPATPGGAGIAISELYITATVSP